ncbi:hypothetical protein DYB32_004659 [Aphanomyces invadans]|uniref:PH domain-containing protein n=1 Tax=Aphanomyces invadans TaxID=157072 RepID=A0A3R7A9I2_9STRA|nr:hypothetical protein DYB32_004659 [Aphanomyces invadans]
MENFWPIGRVLPSQTVTEVLHIATSRATRQVSLALAQQLVALAAMEGYLMKHSANKASHICFGHLDHGYLRFYSSADMSCLVGELRLSGCKVEVKPHKRDDNIPFSFTVESQRVLVKDRTYALSPKETVELSVLGPSVRSDWARAISTWQRRYFKDEIPKTPLDHEHDRARLEEAMAVFRKDVNMAATLPATMSPGLGFRIPSLRKSIMGVLDVLTSRSRVSESSSFDAAPPQPVATA